MNHTINEGNSEVLKRGYVLAIFFVGLVISILIIAYMIDCYKSFRDNQFIKSLNAQKCKQKCSYDDLAITDKITHNYYHNKSNIPPTISILPTNISKSSYV